MGLLKRITDFLFLHVFSSGYTYQNRLTSELPSLGNAGSVVDVFDPSSIRGPCNTPSNRQCWSQGFDIHTDYEYLTPKGVVRKVRAASRVRVSKIN
jgi:hypothetical protein